MLCSVCGSGDVSLLARRCDARVVLPDNGRGNVTILFPAAVCSSSSDPVFRSYRRRWASDSSLASEADSWRFLPWPLPFALAADAAHSATRGGEPGKVFSPGLLSHLDSQLYFTLHDAFLWMKRQLAQHIAYWCDSHAAAFGRVQQPSKGPSPLMQSEHGFSPLPFLSTPRTCTRIANNWRRSLSSRRFVHVFFHWTLWSNGRAKSLITSGSKIPGSKDRGRKGRMWFQTCFAPLWVSKFGVPTRLICADCADLAGFKAVWSIGRGWGFPFVSPTRTYPGAFDASIGGSFLARGF